MRRALLLPLALGVGLAFAATAARANDPNPPKGFTAIFNGHDLAGWHGWNIHGPGGSPLEKMTMEERSNRIDEWTSDSKKHWSVQNGELVNDGHGAYLATDKDYGD